MRFCHASAGTDAAFRAPGLRTELRYRTTSPQRPPELTERRLCRRPATGRRRTERPLWRTRQSRRQWTSPPRSVKGPRLSAELRLVEIS